VAIYFLSVIVSKNETVVDRDDELQIWQTVAAVDWPMLCSAFDLCTWPIRLELVFILKTIS
jgi:hypothetical protein